ncbi:MAG: aminotransferase class I/II-fold pyridoxal phosphate-dependent enzyme, partial [Chthoniobacterales bacterium]
PQEVTGPPTRHPEMTISRRKFAQLLGAGAAAAVARPALSFAKEAAPTPVAASSIVRLSSNENPYGPSAKAFKAMTDAFGLANRYPDEQADILVEALAKLNGVERGQILLGDGSGEILKLCADVFTGPLTNEAKKPSGQLVVAEPTFEAILYHAKLAGAEIVKVPLTPGFAHDLPKMRGAAKKGVIYICNPNNPTASITPAKEIRDFIARTPNDTMILVDEAYHHYADSPEYESMIPLVKDQPNLIVARTFSKIYGMAGLRCGYCVAQSYTVERLRERQSWDSTNIMALVAAGASLEDTEQVSKGRELNAETRAFTNGELRKMGFEGVPSQANFIMVDLKRPVVPIIQTLKSRQIQVGRLFPAMPNHLRLTIGKKAEMEAFLAAFREIVVPA